MKTKFSIKVEVLKSCSYFSSDAYYIVQLDEDNISENAPSQSRVPLINALKEHGYVEAPKSGYWISSNHLKKYCSSVDQVISEITYIHSIYNKLYVIFVPQKMQSVFKQLRNQLKQKNIRVIQYKPKY